MRSVAMSSVLAILLAVGTGCRSGVSAGSNDDGRYVCGFGGCRWVEWTEHERFERAVAAYERKSEDYEDYERENRDRREYDSEKNEWVDIPGWTDEEREAARRSEHARRVGAWNTLHLMASEDRDLVLQLPPIPDGPR